MPHPKPGERLVQPPAVPAGAVYITTAQLRQRYGNLSHMWVERKLRNDPEFPRPVCFGSSFRFFKLADVEDYERRCAMKRT